MAGKGRTGTILHLRKLNGDHELVLVVSRRARVLVAASVLALLGDAGIGFVQKLGDVYRALLALLP